MDENQPSTPTPTDARPDLLGLKPDELAALLPGEPSYRVRSLFRWLSKGADLAEMTDLPLALRTRLSESSVVSRPTPLRRQVSPDKTMKTLWGFPDGAQVESVLMRHRHGASLCLSTQVGCRMGCAFCASTQEGLIRNLTAGEMLSMVIQGAKDAREALSGLVLMGMGEPLDNWENVFRFLQRVNHPDGVGLGWRHISLSTCGLLEGIERLKREALPLTLSVSLHAPDDETRSALMPVNRAVGVDRLLAACRDYFDTTGRRVSYEYTLIDGVNDTQAQAHLLGQKLRGHPTHVNLIVLNPTPGCPYQPSPPEAVRAFQETVGRYGPAVTIRRRLGDQIEAACGQLRMQHRKDMEPFNEGNRHR